MAGPTIAERYKYMTLTQAARRLGIHPAKLRRRLRDGIFPPATHVNEHGLQFFGQDWLRKAHTILDDSFEAESAKNNPPLKQIRRPVNE